MVSAPRAPIGIRAFTIGGGLAFPNRIQNYLAVGNGGWTMHDQNNVFYALALSVVVLITWQYFFATSFLGKPAGPNTSQISPPRTGVAPIGAVAAGDAIIRL